MLAMVDMELNGLAHPGLEGGVAWVAGAGEGAQGVQAGGVEAAVG